MWNKGMALIIAITGLRSFRLAPSQRGIKGGFSRNLKQVTTNKPNMLKGDSLRKGVDNTIKVLEMNK